MGRNRLSQVVFVFSVVATFFLPGNAWAQNAKLAGTVLDASGAAVPQVTVTATGTNTGVPRTTQTTETGAYAIPGLIPSDYDITFSKTGFRTVRFEKTTLNIDQTLTIDVKLEIATVQQTVEVAGSVVAPISTEDAQISNVVNSTEVKTLPLILRDPYQLVLLGPGAIQSNTRLGGFSANGQREQNNNFLIDGIDNNDTDVPGIAGGLNSLNPDSTQEFRVITNNFSAEYGRDNGAIIDVKTPSGTNNFHGGVLWFGRYDALGARDFFNHQPDTPKDPYVRNLYGGSISGPIKKNKAFFYGNYEGHRWVTSLTNVSTVPTDAFKTGVFTYTNTDQAGNPVSVPIDVSQAGAGNNALPYGPDPTIKQIFSNYPSPTSPLGNGYSGLLFFPSSDRNNDNNFTVRVDYTISKNNSMFVRYLFDQGTSSAPFHDDILPGGLGATSTYQRTQNAGLGVVSVLNAGMVNEFRIGFNRTNLQFNCNGLSTFDSLGAQFIDQFGRGSDFGLSDPVGGGFTSFGCTALVDSNSQARFTGTYQTTDYLTYTHGNHTMKFGGEYRDAYSNGFANFFSRQAFAFDPFGNGIGVLTGITDPTALGDQSLNDAVGVLLGATTSQTENQFFNSAQVRVPSDERGFRQHEVGVFAEDTWKVRPNLTMTFGLRWEYFGVPYEVNGNFSSFFGDSTRAVPDSSPFLFATLIRGQSQLYSNNFNGWDPRVGIAWDPFKKGRTSVRAGFGIFRDRVYGNLFENTNANPPFLQTANAALPANNSLQGVSAPASVTTSAQVFDNTFFGPSLIDPAFRTPNSENWNFGIQQQIGNSLTVEVNYVGVHGIHEFRSLDPNPPQSAMVQNLLNFCVPGNPNNHGFSNQFDNTSDQCSVAAVTSSNLWVGDYFGTLPDLLPDGSFNPNAFNNGQPGPAVLNRAFTDSANGFDTGGVVVKSIAFSHYNGMQANVTKRYSHGFQAQLAYTWSHSLDDASDPISPAVTNRTFPRNSNNLGPEYGASDFDVRQRVVINFVYDPNIGIGKDHLNSGIAGHLLQGWEIAGIVAFQTGLPYDVFGVRDTQHTGLSDRATLDDPTMLKKAPANANPTTQVFTGVNVAAFNPDTVTNSGFGGSTPWGVVSNLHRNPFYGPGINNWDAVLSKNTSIGDRFTLQMRFEFYNLFNRVQFTQPNNSLANPDLFGFSTGQVGRPDGTTGARQIQLGLKLMF